MFSFVFSLINPSVIGRFLEVLHGWIKTEFSEKSQGGVQSETGGEKP